MEYKCFSSQHLIWAFGVGLPMLIVWVIGVPSIALFILIKYRKELEDMKIKRYLLLLYQGLKPNAFYWEFVNTSRKILMLCCIVFLSSVPASYGIMSAIRKYIIVKFKIVMMIIILRVQISIQPYKLKENNDLEVLSTTAGTLLLFCAILFVNEDIDVPGFTVIVSVILFIINFYFLILWSFYFMNSWNIKNRKFNIFLNLFGMAI